MKKLFRRFDHLALVSAIILSSAVTLSAAPAMESFDNDSLNGWGPTVIGTTLTLQTTGGNPGGFAKSVGFNMGGSLDIGCVTMESQWCGSYADANIHFFSVDLSYTSGIFDATWFRLRGGNGGQNGWVYPLTTSFPPNSWQTYSVTFDPAWSDVQARAAGWLTDADINPIAHPSPSFDESLETTFWVEVRISGTGNLVAGIDNIVLTTVPEPNSGLLLGLAGLLIWIRQRVRCVR